MKTQRVEVHRNQLNEEFTDIEMPGGQKNAQAAAKYKKQQTKVGKGPAGMRHIGDDAQNE